MPLLSIAGFYILIGLLVWIVTLSSPPVRKLWESVIRKDSLSPFVLLIICLIWPIRLLYFIKGTLVRAYGYFVDSRKINKGNRMCETYLDDLRKEELEATGDPERLKYLVRQRQIVEKVEAVMKGLCPDCRKELDFSRIEADAYCRNCKKGFSKNYDPRNE